MLNYNRKREYICFNDEGSWMHSMETKYQLVGFSYDAWTNELDENINGIFVKLLIEARALNKELKYYYRKNNHMVCEVYEPSGKFVSMHVV